MHKNKLLIAFAISFLTLISSSSYASISSSLSSAIDSVVRFVNGTFSANIDSNDLQKVYKATLLALNNNDYNVVKNTINNGYADITGTYNTEKSIFNSSGISNFSVRIVKSNKNTIQIFIKIGTFGDKQASVDLLADIQNNLGI
ncbi:MAG: DUF3568 domain-containing protein [Francisella sp.]